MDYFNWLSQQNFQTGDRFDLWDFSDLSKEQYLALLNHPSDAFSINLSSLTDEIYISTYIKLHTDNNFQPVYHTDRKYICPVSPLKWKETVEPLIRANIIRRRNLNSQQTTTLNEQLENLSSSELGIAESLVEGTKNRVYHYIISKEMMVMFLRKSELWLEQPNNRYTFIFTVVPPWPGGYLNTCDMSYIPSYPDPIYPDPLSFKKYSNTKGSLFARPLTCLLYIMGESNKSVVCPMCTQYVSNYYHKCIRTDSGNTVLINRLRENDAPFYIICHRFKYNFHSHKCLEHLNLNCDKYKIFNGMLYEKMVDPLCFTFASMLNVREYVIPSIAVYENCHH